MNRFFDIEGDTSTQLAPWTMQALKEQLQDKWGYKDDIALFKLQQALRFRSDVAGGVIVVPVGFISDLASIPREAWSIFMAPDDPHIALGAWIHDLLCQNKGSITLEDGTTIHLSSNQAAAILAYEAMADLGADDFQQHAVFEAVSIFGPHWP